MLAQQYRVPRQHLNLILTPIDTDAFHPMDRAAACRAAGLDPTRRYLLYVGRLDDRVKRVSALIRSFAKAAQQYPDYRLVIVGDGSDRTKLKQCADETAAGRIEFFGWVSGAAALAPLYNAPECLQPWLVASQIDGIGLGSRWHRPQAEKRTSIHCLRYRLGR
jgi:glycosyltransferase involved in cell wall biosynthesis